MEKKKQRFDILDQIPEAKAILAWKLAQHSKKKKSMIAPNKPTSKLVNPSMSFSLFKFKQGCHCKPKNVNRRTKKKKKGQGQPLGLHKQQLCKYHRPIIYPLVYPGDEPVMTITVDPTIVPPLKIPSISPSLVAVSIDELVLVPDNKTELEKLVEVSDADLNVVIKLGSLCSVMIPKTFLSSGISTADVVANNSVYHITLSNLHDDKTVVAGSKIKPTVSTKLILLSFFDDSP